MDYNNINELWEDFKSSLPILFTEKHIEICKICFYAGIINYNQLMRELHRLPSKEEKEKYTTIIYNELREFSKIILHLDDEFNKGIKQN